MKPYGALLTTLLIGGCQLLPGHTSSAPSKKLPKSVGKTTTTAPTVSSADRPQPINTDIVGVTCFRGNQTRTYYGEGPIPTGHVEMLWKSPIGGAPSGHWSGVGWTGQPLIVEWPKATRQYMNFLKPGGPEREIIVGALDGQVHFFDAETGKPSRKTLPTPGRYPIKGTVSVDPRGFPLLYVGCGVNVGGKPGYRVFSLLDFHEVLYLPAFDPTAPRKWPGSDSNVLMMDDTFYLPAENGLFYKVKLNASWENGKLSVNPKVQKFLLSKPGTESSMSVLDGMGYCTDNHGGFFRIDLEDPKKIKKLAELGDDTDSSTVIDKEGNFYVGIEKDKRTDPNAKGIIYKLTKDGKILWRWQFQAGSITVVEPPNNPINGGILSTGALSEDQKTIYYTTSHHPHIGRGFLVALDTATGKLRWKKQLTGFAWSSPIVRGGVVFAADSSGSVFIVDAETGETRMDQERISAGANVESSPIVWKGRVYVGVRGGGLACFGVKK